jgi:hypothetical protein
VYSSGFRRYDGQVIIEANPLTDMCDRPGPPVRSDPPTERLAPPTESTAPLAPVAPSPTSSVPGGGEAGGALAALATTTSNPPSSTLRGRAGDAELPVTGGRGGWPHLAAVLLVLAGALVHLGRPPRRADRR